MSLHQILCAVVTTLTDMARAFLPAFAAPKRRRNRTFLCVQGVEPRGAPAIYRWRGPPDSSGEFGIIDTWDRGSDWVNNAGLGTPTALLLRLPTMYFSTPVPSRSAG